MKGSPTRWSTDKRSKAPRASDGIDWIVAGPETCGGSARSAVSRVGETGTASNLGDLPSEPRPTERALRVRAPETFQDMCLAYRSVLEAHIAPHSRNRAKPVDVMHALVASFGAHFAGPQDLLDVHLVALESATSTATHTAAQTLAAEARLVALEMMGRLLDHYRIGPQPGDT